MRIYLFKDYYAVTGWGIMKALIGYGALFIAIGIILAYFIVGLWEFVITIALLICAYILLCKCSC